MQRWQYLKNRIYEICMSNYQENVEPDIDKILGLAYDWMQTKKQISNKDIDDFCNNLDIILKEEIQLRMCNTIKDVIWLTK